jgi:Mn-dependent DtxR family transcriptional regulator
MGTVKYTKEICEQIVREYKEGRRVEEIAQTLDTSPRSVIAKLSSLGVYQPKPYLNKRGEAPRKKEDLLDDLAQVLGVDLWRLESLEKANKSVILLLIEAYKQKSP